MAHYGRGRASYQSGNHAASSAQYDYPAPPEHNIVCHPQCNVADIPEEWMYNLKHSWNVFRASEPVKHTLYNYFGDCQNPYASALQIMSLCNDFYHSKAKSMASFVIEAFASWITPQEDYYRHMCTRELKKEAFSIVTQQKNIALTRLVFQTFHLGDNATDYLDQIRFMANCKMYKEACQCASLLNLTKYFQLEEVVLPLILQDKQAVAEEALVQVPEMQKELVVMLDNLLGKKNLETEMNDLLMKLDVPDVKIEVVYHPKPLGKLVARLIKKFELPQELAPNLNKKRTGGALQFLIRKRYKDNLNSESWNEMVKDAVGDDRQLQLELVCTVNSYGDTHEALYWAHFFKIPMEQWPYNVRLLDREDPDAKYCQPKNASDEDDGSEENWGNEDASFLTLSLPDSALVMVNTVDALHGLIDIFTRSDVTVAGIDSEWKPAFAGRQSELALVQVATWEQVYIVDVVGLAGQAPDLWSQLGHCFFRNKEVLKLGFDIVNDLQMIKNALPEMGQIKPNGHGYLDLSLLWKRLANSYKLDLPYRDESKNSTSESLSQLVFLTMGRALNKANQFSNWEQRPLRIGQLRYAALDAFCLLEVYEVLKRCCEEQNIPFLEICDEIMLNYKVPRKSGGNSNASKKKSPILIPSISIVPSSIAPPVVKDDPETSNHRSMEKSNGENNELGRAADKDQQSTHRDVQSFGRAADRDRQTTYRDVQSLMTDLDRRISASDENARAVWEDEVEARVKELRVLVSFGRKKFRNDSLVHDASQNDRLSSTTSGQLCWYHSRFGPGAVNCQPPCDFEKEHADDPLTGWYREQSQVLKQLSDDLKKMSPHSSQYRSRSRSRSRSRGQSRNRSYSRSPNRTTNRSYSRSPARSQTPTRDCFNGNVRSPPSYCSSEVICWYHRQFGETAKRCQSPCDFYDEYFTECGNNW